MISIESGIAEILEYTDNTVIQMLLQYWKFDVNIDLRLTVLPSMAEKYVYFGHLEIRNTSQKQGIGEYLIDGESIRFSPYRVKDELNIQQPMLIYHADAECFDKLKAAVLAVIDGWTK